VRKRDQRCTTVGWSSNLWLLHWAGPRAVETDPPGGAVCAPPRGPCFPPLRVLVKTYNLLGGVRGLDKRLERPPKQLPSGTIPHPRVWGEWGARGPQERPQVQQRSSLAKKNHKRGTGSWCGKEHTFAVSGALAGRGFVPGNVDDGSVLWGRREPYQSLGRHIAGGRDGGSVRVHTGSRDPTRGFSL